MKKKIITSSLLGLLAFSATPAFATEQIAFSIFGASAYLNSCSTCHSGKSGQESKGNLKAGINAAYQKDKFGLSTLKALVTAPALTCTLPQVLNATKTTCITPVPTCAAPQVLNSTKDACVTPPPPTCVVPKILNAAQTACVAPPPPTCVAPEILNPAKTACVIPPPTCSATEILNATKDACVAKPVVPVCVAPEVLNAAKTACVAKPTTPTSTTNTKPKLNLVAQQWDAQVDEPLSIPLSVNDAEQDDFKILTSKLDGSTLSDVYENDAGFPTIDFEWTPTLANVNKIQAITFQAKEITTTKKYSSNKISVKVRVWAAGDRDAASITKLNVMKSKFSAGSLNLSGNVKFNNLLTAAERQAFIAQTLDLTIIETGDAVPLTLGKNGSWTVSIPMISAPCDITLEFAGQNASRTVVGCNATTASIDTTTIIAANDGHDNDDDNHNDDKKDKSNKKHDD